MPEEVQRRAGEGHSDYVKRSKQAGRAATATSKASREDAHKPWKAAWEKRTGKKYGIGTHGEYMNWLDEERKKRATASAGAPKKVEKAPEGGSAQDVGDAMAKEKKKDE